LFFLKDLPDLCSLAGLAYTVYAICISIIVTCFAAMIGMVRAVAFDWIDAFELKQLREENSKLKRLVADLRLA
jgi:CDP-diacylglycerol--serine O-phosphatidyltransferase